MKFWIIYTLVQILFSGGLLQRVLASAFFLIFCRRSTIVAKIFTPPLPPPTPPPPPLPSTIKKLPTALVGKNNDDILPSPAALSIGYIREGKSILRKLD